MTENSMNDLQTKACCSKYQARIMTYTYPKKSPRIGVGLKLRQIRQRTTMN